MKIRIPALSFLLAFFLWSNQVLSEEIYIRYDQSCMHRLEYAYGFTPPNMEYIKYQIMLGENEAVILEIGPENAGSPQSFFNDPSIACGDPAINKELVDKILERMASENMPKASGRRATVSRSETLVGQIEDWEALTKYISRTKNFQLFERRISAPAFRELFEMKGAVPGLTPFTKVSLKHTSLKEQ